MGLWHCAFVESRSTWSCRDGSTLVDEHGSLNDALEHLTEMLDEELQSSVTAPSLPDSAGAPGDSS